MKTLTAIWRLGAISLAVVALARTGWAGGAPATPLCGHQGHCLCVPNVRNYGYYPTQWRRWSTEARRDEHFPESVGRERIPTPPGDPTEPMQIERVPSRPIPGLGEFPIPDGILPPDGPFQPEAPILPEPAIPGGIPFVPSTTPGTRPLEGIPGLPTPAPLQPNTEPAVPDPQQGSQHVPQRIPQQGPPPRRQLEPPMETTRGPQPIPQRASERQAPVNGSNARFETEPAPTGPNRGAPLRQPDAWMTHAHPRVDTRYQRPPAQPASHWASETAEFGREAMGGSGSPPPAATTNLENRAPAEAPLALDGFCPVTLSNLEQWQQGRREFMAVYQDRAFHMAGPDERRQFLANPHRFAPMFGGIDPVLVVDEQRWTPGSIQYSAIYKGRIYMLSSEANLKRFHADPRRYAFELE